MTDDNWTLRQVVLATIKHWPEASGVALYQADTYLGRIPPYLINGSHEFLVALAEFPADTPSFEIPAGVDTWLAVAVLLGQAIPYELAQLTGEDLLFLRQYTPELYWELNLTKPHQLWDYQLLIDRLQCWLAQINHTTALTWLLNEYGAQARVLHQLGPTAYYSIILAIGCGDDKSPDYSYLDTSALANWPSVTQLHTPRRRDSFFRLIWLGTGYLVLPRYALPSQQQTPLLDTNRRWWRQVTDVVGVGAAAGLPSFWMQHRRTRRYLKRRRRSWLDWIGC